MDSPTPPQRPRNSPPVPMSSSASAPNVRNVDLERQSSGKGMPASASTGDFSRKRSLIRPERSRINKDHPTYYYTQHASQQKLNTHPSSTGIDPNSYVAAESSRNSQGGPSRSTSKRSIKKGGQETTYTVPGLDDGESDVFGYTNDKETPSGKSDSSSTTPQSQDHVQFESDVGSSPLQRHATNDPNSTPGHIAPDQKLRPNPVVAEYKPPSLWHVYCNVVTFWAPGFFLRWCGMPAKPRQSAWREKMGLISVILMIGCFVGYLTFGFTETVCNTNDVRLRSSEINSGYLVINGRAYELTHSKHPAAAGITSGSNVLYPPVNAGGQDASFLFQNVNSHCKGFISPTENSSIPHDSDGNMAWYFPCKTFNLDGSTEVNYTWPYYTGYACHTSTTAREAYYGLTVNAEVYFTWDDIRNSSRNLVVYNGYVLDLDLLDWLDFSDVELTTNRFDEIHEASQSGIIRGTDVTRLLTSSTDRRLAKCMLETIKVGSIDTDSIGCIASDVVLYVSLVFIVVIVLVKFFIACLFNWFLAWRLGVKYTDAEKRRVNEIEDWSDDIYRPAPHIVNAYNTGIAAANRGSRFFPKTSRFTVNYGSRSRSRSESRSRSRMAPTMASQGHSSTSHLIVPGSLYNRTDDNVSSKASYTGTGGSSPAMPSNSSTLSVDKFPRGRQGAPNDVESIRMSKLISTEDNTQAAQAPVAYYQDNIVPQPPPDFQPFGFPLAHTILLVTAYSESVEGLRTTFDSLATTDYPNSHKLIIAICDGIVRGAGNDMSTPEICVSMMTDLAVPADEVQPFSYVAVAHGSKRHNMAKVYAGFYAYDDETVDPSKQQRVPMLTIVKCGTPEEAESAKPGNRGKRDAQIILMSFFQKVMFNERMTELEYEIFSGIWKVTGISPEMYEIMLMVDADTKVYPDSLTHMIACMVHDRDVMGLCGETKIANKRQSWVTAIQVFEYYVSHHLTKAFESAFGSVTCLPGCFCMYRIKAPKGDDGYWVPILANPDIVERYSNNVVETLHEKNLLLLGEDRYLSTLMLRTFPKRKQIFVPQAVCKTIAPDTLSVLMSQRRRWINSTVHNLMELTLVNTLCGVFCISMQFVIMIELIGTLVLPVAIAFTLYVVIIAIVRKPVPVIPLVLLGMILGLPGVLVVVTAHRWSYLVWMVIYILALPVWNFLLPMNAYWKFDDFSWGETRQVQGGDKGHDEAEGEFDSSHIKMRKWREWEQEKKMEMQDDEYDDFEDYEYPPETEDPVHWAPN
ncbi:chitin synthase-domain-containing protein [Lipomyces oligophaga]|uniref:chitin synthase-domain-containing protein n=1 Tax=Lipomyces oligophaga TaxID=45792 RepID=UPI0034CF6E04